MRRLLVFAAAALVGCTFGVTGLPISLLDSGVPAGELDLAVPSDDLRQELSDLASSADLRGIDLSTTSDLASGGIGGCTLTTARVCVDANHAARCDLNLGTNLYTPTTDRTCPPGSTCAAGYCQPPANATACTKLGDCMGTSVCDFYIVSGAMKGFCSMPFPTMGGDVFANCAAPGGADLTCKTGYCAVDQLDSSAHQCLFPCTQSADCPGNNDCDPISAPSTIEGVSTSNIRFCTM